MHRKTKWCKLLTQIMECSNCLESLDFYLHALFLGCRSHVGMLPDNTARSTYGRLQWPSSLDWVPSPVYLDFLWIFSKTALSSYCLPAYHIFWWCRLFLPSDHTGHITLIHICFPLPFLDLLTRSNQTFMFMMWSSAHACSTKFHSAEFHVSP